MKIEYLADHEILVSILAQYNYSEWGKTAWKNSEEVYAAYTGTLNKNHIPLTFVALSDDNELMGFVSLIEHDMESRKDLSPWLAGLYVLPEYRKQGVGEALVKRIIIEAKKLHIEKIYLFTGNDKRVDFYHRLGWCVMESIICHGEDSVIMVYTAKEKGNYHDI